jgi:peptidoglycan/xylan/chitin deacetylase (PgdA/CDA1 family)
LIQLYDKIAYLTFDDGPTVYTNEIINILNQYQVKGTFFIIGINAKRFPDVIQRLKKEGHQIGNHSYTHDYNLIYLNATNFINELELTDKIIYNLTGQHHNLFRFPGGSSTLMATPEQITEYIKILQQQGFEYFDWNVDSGDILSDNAGQIVNNIEDQIKDKTIALILLHSTRLITVEALPRIIILLRTYGFQMQLLTKGSYHAHHRLSN